MMRLKLKRKRNKKLLSRAFYRHLTKPLLAGVCLHVCYEMKTNMSAGDGDYVVLFKSVSEKEDENDDAYSNGFLSAGFVVTLVPVLDFEFVNLDDLLVKLKSPEDYAGIIFSSPRCVTGVEQAVGSDPTILKKWGNHKHFVVGEKSARMVENLRLVARGKEAGNAKNLARIIIKDRQEKPFLYPKGSLTKDSFKSELEGHQISVDDLVIYKTKPHPQLEQNIMNIQRQLSGKSVYFVYFSPSGVNFTLPLLQTFQFDLSKVKFVAIGPMTQQGLQEKGLEVAATSFKPDPEALMDTVLQFKKQVN